MTSIHKGKKEIQGNAYNLSHPKHSRQIEGDSKNRTHPEQEDSLHSLPSTSVKLHWNQIKYRKLIKKQISKHQTSNKAMHVQRDWVVGVLNPLKQRVCFVVFCFFLNAFVVSYVQNNKQFIFIIPRAKTSICWVPVDWDFQTFCKNIYI